MWPCSEREGALRWKFQPHCLLSRLLSVSGPQFPRLYNGDSKAQLSRADVLPGTLCARHLTPVGTGQVLTDGEQPAWARAGKPGGNVGYTAAGLVSNSRP